VLVTVTAGIKMDEAHVVEALHEARERLISAGGKVLLDFAAVRRLDPKAVRAMAEFAEMAQHQGVKVVLRDVNVDVYKVLKLVKLAKQFSFVN